MTNQKDIEQAAAEQHEIWSHWMKYLFSQCKELEMELPNDSVKVKTGNLIIPVEKVERWRLQMNTPYSQLSEKEKQSDRDIVKQFIADFKE